MFIRVGSFKIFETEVFCVQNERVLLDIFLKIYFHYSIVNKERCLFASEFCWDKTVKNPLVTHAGMKGGYCGSECRENKYSGGL